MPNCRVGAVIDALVTKFGTGTAAKVVDGPPILSAAPADFVLVGANDEAESTVPITQAWAGLGAKARDETGEIPCAVVSQSGSTNIKTHRDRCLTILGELETALVADPTLSGAVASGWLLVSEGSLTQVQTPNGARASINFSVFYKARL